MSKRTYIVISYLSKKKINRKVNSKRARAQRFFHEHQGGCLIPMIIMLRWLITIIIMLGFAIILLI